MSEGTIKQHHSLAMGSTSPGYGSHGGPSGGGRNPGYAKGGKVGKHVPHSGHHNLDGTIGHNDHHHSHKSHGHHVSAGVHHHKTGGVTHDHSGLLKNGDHGRHSGPSNNQFGPHMPHGGTLKRW